MIDGVCDSFEMFFVIVVVPLVSTDYCLLWEFSSKGYFLFVFYECSLQIIWLESMFCSVFCHSWNLFLWRSHMQNSRKSTAVILFFGLRRTQSHDQDHKSDSNIGTVFFRNIAIVQGPNIFLRALTVSTTCSVLLSGQLDGLPPLLLRHGNVAHAALTRYVTLFTHSGVSQSHPQAHTRQPWRVTSSDPSWEAGERNALWDVRWA